MKEVLMLKCAGKLFSSHCSSICLSIHLPKKVGIEGCAWTIALPILPAIIRSYGEIGQGGKPSSLLCHALLLSLLAPALLMRYVSQVKEEYSYSWWLDSRSKGLLSSVLRPCFCLAGQRKEVQARAVFYPLLGMGSAVNMCYRTLYIGTGKGQLVAWLASAGWIGAGVCGFSLQVFSARAQVSGNTAIVLLPLQEASFGWAAKSAGNAANVEVGLNSSC